MSTFREVRYDHSWRLFNNDGMTGILEGKGYPIAYVVFSYIFMFLTKVRDIWGADGSGQFVHSAGC